MENGKWKINVEFKQFVDVYNAAAGPAEKKHLDTAVDVIFQYFRVIMEKHMVAKWTSTEIVEYCPGGDPHHAKEFACWLIHHQNNKDALSSNTSKPVEFSFEKKLITLGETHRQYHGDTVLDVNIDLQDSMNFITKNADPIATLKDPFIEHNWAHIESLATESNAVNIWDKSSTLVFEKYAPFRLDIIQKRKAIQLHEYTQILAADPNKEVTLAKVINFQPMSVEMKVFLKFGYQRKLVDKEKAIRASTDKE